jgi:hypothetical protein
MKTIKVMSIIGLVLFVLLLIVALGEEITDPEEALGIGLVALLYGIPYSIVGLVHSSKKRDGSRE